MAEGGYLGLAAKRKRQPISIIDPDKCYPMNRPNMGHALIMNNVASEKPQTNVDVVELTKTFRTLGFQVRVENNCTQAEMTNLEKWLCTEEIHRDSNCVAVTVICHGNDQGWLRDTNKKKGWTIEDFVEKLSTVGSLVGKPKLFFVQACRGRQRNVRVDSKSDLGEPETFAAGDPVTLPKKADMFIAFATVPGYVAAAGDDEGSHYLQAFATFLREQYMKKDLESIYRMVKQYMTRVAQGCQCAEDRNSLTYLLRFSEYWKVTMRHIKTHDTGLVFWNRSKFTVMPSTGDVVLWGKTSDKDSPMLHVYKSSATSWEKDRSKSGFCEHEVVRILPVTIQNQELLAVSCQWCLKIRLYNMRSGEITTVFSDSRYFPGPMCHGDTGQIYVMHAAKGPKTILQLNCSHPEFSLSKTIQSAIEQYYATCYMPTHRLIAVSSADPGMIRAVHCDTDDIVWEVAGTVSGLECCPHGMIYSPDHDALLVADGRNHRVLVISPQDGSVRQVVQLSQDMGVICELCLFKKQVAVQHNDVDNVKVSYFTLH